MGGTGHGGWWRLSPASGLLAWGLASDMDMHDLRAGDDYHYAADCEDVYRAIAKSMVWP
jgi:hypothetical protein